MPLSDLGPHYPFACPEFSRRPGILGWQCLSLARLKQPEHIAIEDLKNSFHPIHLFLRWMPHISVP